VGEGYLDSSFAGEGSNNLENMQNEQGPLGEFHVGSVRQPVNGPALPPVYPLGPE
jgi:hypothetical protein